MVVQDVVESCMPYDFIHQALVSFCNIWSMAYCKSYGAIIVFRIMRKKRSRDWKLVVDLFEFPHTPYFNVGCFWVFWSEPKKRSFMSGQVDDACTCNIEVGGVGDAVQNRLIYVASVFFARPGVKRFFWTNVFGFCHFALLFFLQDFKACSSMRRR